MVKKNGGGCVVLFFFVLLSDLLIIQAFVLIKLFSVGGGGRIRIKRIICYASWMTWPSSC